MKKTNLIAAALLTVFASVAGTLAVTDMFSDLDKGHYAYDAFMWANEKGLITGYENGDAGADDALTRGQMAVVLMRYNDYMMKNMEEMDKMMMEMKEDMMMEDDKMMEEEMGMTVKGYNLTDSFTLSPGLLIVHTDDASVDFEGGMIPAEMEALVEWGDPAELKTLLEGMEGVMAVYQSDAMPAGEMAEWMIDEMDESYHVSFLSMIVESNDGYVYATAPLMEGEMAMAMAYDGGTEENSDLASGFEGGQPDGTKTAEENMNAGTPTEPQENVMLHEQVAEGTELFKLMVE